MNTHTNSYFLYILCVGFRKHIVGKANIIQPVQMCPNVSVERVSVGFGDSWRSCRCKLSSPSQSCCRNYSRTNINAFQKCYTHALDWLCGDQVFSHFSSPPSPFPPPLPQQPAGLNRQWHVEREIITGNCVGVLTWLCIQVHARWKFSVNGHDIQCGV